MTTTIVAETLAKALAECDPNRIADALRAYGIGMALSPQKYTWLGSTGATAVDITTAGFLSRATPGTKTPTLPQSQLALPPAMHIATLRVTTGPSGSVGAYQVTDAGGTASLLQIAGASGNTSLSVQGTALISDDGATVTFPAQISGFVIEYVPRSAYDVTLLFEHA